MTPLDQRRAAMRLIVCFGIVSLFADVTYEGSRSLIGPYLRDLGASASQVGLIAGLGEMLAASLRLFSGRLADRTHAYWTITMLGYGMNVIVVPALAFAGNWQTAALLVIAERTGKALRAPARDVLLSQATAKVGHGWGFGLHAAMDQTGAVLGPLLMAGAVAGAGRIAPAFLRLALPAALTVMALFAARALNPPESEPPAPVPGQKLPRVFWFYTAAAGLLAFGFADFALLSFHLGRTGAFSTTAIPLLYAVAMGVNGLTALLYGRMFDRWGVRVLVGGIVVAALALPLGFLTGGVWAAAGIVLWGAGLGVQDATLRAGIARIVSMDKRGLAFGAFNAVYGVAWFAGSAVMGLLYEGSPALAAACGAAAQLAAAAAFSLLLSTRTLAYPATKA